MDRFDPTAPGAFGHGGTFDNNVLRMAAGHAGLTRVPTVEASARLNAPGERLRAAMQDRIAARGVAAARTGFGSLFNLHVLHMIGSPLRRWRRWTAGPESSGIRRRCWRAGM
jgi:glutamate-1-semialdehyde 2,1-aminomutase